MASSPRRRPRSRPRSAPSSTRPERRLTSSHGLVAVIAGACAPRPGGVRGPGKRRRGRSAQLRPRDRAPIALRPDRGAALPRRPGPGEDEDRLRRPAPWRARPPLAGHDRRRRRRPRLQLDRGAVRALGRWRCSAPCCGAATSSSSTSAAPASPTRSPARAAERPDPGIHRDRPVRGAARRPLRRLHDRRSGGRHRRGEDERSDSAGSSSTATPTAPSSGRPTRCASRSGCGAWSSTPPIPATTPTTGRSAGRPARAAIACRRAPRCSGDAVARFRRVVGSFHAAERSTEALISFLLGAGTLAPRSYLSLDDADRRFLRGEPRRLNRLIAPGEAGHGPTCANSPTASRSRSSATTTRCSGTPTRRSRSASGSSPRRSAASPRAITSRPSAAAEYLLSSAARLTNCLAWPAPPRGRPRAGDPRRLAGAALVPDPGPRRRAGRHHLGRRGPPGHQALSALAALRRPEPRSRRRASTSLSPRPRSG